MDLDIAPYLNQLSGIFREIDLEYEKSQKYYGDFSCAGCTDNCCTTVFHHHTLLENLYLIEGFSTLKPERMKVILQRAGNYCRELVKKPFDQPSLTLMCPLNVDNLCLLYEYRPLICRVHGLPGFLFSKKGRQEFPGCKRFQELHEERTGYRIDRTPFYTQFAALEGQLREELSFFQNYRKTISEMILDYEKDEITMVKKILPRDFQKNSPVF